MSIINSPRSSRGSAGWKISESSRMQQQNKNRGNSFLLANRFTPVKNEKSSSKLVSRDRSRLNTSISRLEESTLNIKNNQMSQSFVQVTQRPNPVQNIVTPVKIIQRNQKDVPLINYSHEYNLVSQIKIAVHSQKINNNVVQIIKQDWHRFKSQVLKDLNGKEKQIQAFFQNLLQIIEKLKMQQTNIQKIEQIQQKTQPKIQQPVSALKQVQKTEYQIKTASEAVNSPLKQVKKIDSQIKTVPETVNSPLKASQQVAQTTKTNNNQPTVKKILSFNQEICQQFVFQFFQPKANKNGQLPSQSFLSEQYNELILPTQVSIQPVPNKNSLSVLSIQSPRKSQIISSEPTIETRQGRLSRVKSSIQQFSVEQCKRKLLAVSKSNQKLLPDSYKSRFMRDQQIILKGTHQLGKFYNAIEKLRTEVNQIKQINDVKQNNNKIYRKGK